jgi:hypothetical protein
VPTERAFAAVLEDQAIVLFAVSMRPNGERHLAFAVGPEEAASEIAATRTVAETERADQARDHDGVDEASLRVFEPDRDLRISDGFDLDFDRAFSGVCSRRERDRAQDERTEEWG